MLRDLFQGEVNRIGDSQGTLIVLYRLKSLSSKILQNLIILAHHNLFRKKILRHSIYLICHMAVHQPAVHLRQQLVSAEAAAVPGKLELACAQGVRMIAPAWNAQNALTGSCMTGGGLTAQGKEFVRRAQKLGMILDVSHISEKAFWDLCDITEKPFVASHSNSRAICKHVRNLTDEQFKALCEAGGTAWSL